MSKQTLNNLFQLEKRTSRPGTRLETGTGLGLIVVKDLVEANGWQLEVSSEENIGTTFGICFQLIPNPHQS